jgi:hypothetical protein
MTDFSTESSVINGLARCTINGFSQDIAKATITTVSGFDYSGWLAGGNPVAGVAPTTWAHPTQATAGALNPRYINPAAGTTCRILAASLRPSVANQPYILRDRLGHMAALSGTSVAAQTVNATLTTPAADGRCEAGGGDVDWWIEWYVVTGSTAINMTVAVTYSDNSTGNIVVAIPASVPASRRYLIRPSSGNLSIKAVNTLTNSASTLTAGNYGITATERKVQFSVPVANTEWNADWALTNMPDLGSNACLELSTFAIGTAFGTMTGNLRAGTA